MLSFLTRRSGHAPRRPTRVRPARDVIAVQSAGMSVLLDLRRDLYFTLDEVGTVVWHEIELGRGAAEAAQRVCAEYDAPDDVALHDVEEFLAELVGRGLAVHA